MTRRLHNLLTLLSLLLCIESAALCMRSYFAPDRAAWIRPLVSADGYKYTGGPMVPAFEQAFATLEKVPCDILLTPHPGASGMLEKLAARDGGKPDAFVVPGACKAYVATARTNLARRLETERK